MRPIELFGGLRLLPASWELLHRRLDWFNRHHLALRLQVFSLMIAFGVTAAVLDLADMSTQEKLVMTALGVFLVAHAVTLYLGQERLRLLLHSRPNFSTRQAQLQSNYSRRGAYIALATQVGIFALMISSPVLRQGNVLLALIRYFYMIVGCYAELTYIIVGWLMLRLTLAYQQHLSSSVDEVRMRSRRELRSQTWPSDHASSQIVDVKYLARLHQYIIEMTKETSAVLTPYVIICLLHQIVRFAFIVAVVLAKGAVGEFYQSAIILVVRFFGLFVLCRCGTLIQKENEFLNQVLKLKIAEPLAEGQQGHPDWNSLKVIEARTAVDFYPALNAIFGSPITLDSLKRLHSFFVGTFLFLLLIFPIKGKTTKD